MEDYESHLFYRMTLQQTDGREPIQITYPVL